VANDYVVNGTTLPCPTTGRWVPRRPVDVQGDNRPLYAPVRSYELRWNLQSFEDWAVLVAEFENLQTTGTAVVELPAYPTITGGSYEFREYSGCTLDEPAIGPFFNQEYPTNVALIIGNIRTS
jgi:hypothetical protein